MSFRRRIASVQRGGLESQALSEAQKADLIPKVLGLFAAKEQTESLEPGGPLQALYMQLRTGIHAAGSTYDSELVALREGHQFSPHDDSDKAAQAIAELALADVHGKDRSSPIATLLKFAEPFSTALHLIAAWRPEHFGSYAEQCRLVPLAQFLLWLAWQDYEKYGKVAWLNENWNISSLTPEASKPPSSLELADGGKDLFKAALDLPTAELLDVANLLLSVGRERRAVEEQELLVAREEALSNIGRLTLLAADTKRRIESEVVRAKKTGASWADIGNAAQIRRDVAHKRWSGLMASAEESDQST